MLHGNHIRYIHSFIATAIHILVQYFVELGLAFLVLIDSTFP